MEMPKSHYGNIRGQIYCMSEQAWKGLGGMGDISDTGITGSIPSELGNLRGMQQMWLQLTWQYNTEQKQPIDMILAFK